MNIIRLIIVAFLFCLGATAQNHKTSKPQKNEGIHSMLRRHGLNPIKYEKDFIELNKRNIGKNNSLFADRTYKIPLQSDSKPEIEKPKTNLLFGKKYEQITIRDNALEGAVFYLLSGHGGPDPGAIAHQGKNMLCEDEYAYDVTLRLARRLMEHNATVYMIIQDKNDGIRDESILKPDKDEVCYPNLTIPLNQKKRLQQRVDAVNELNKKHPEKYQRAVEIHIDSRSKKQNIDVYFYYKTGDVQGRATAKNMHETFKAKYAQHQPDRGYNGTISTRQLFTLENITPSTVFIELGNMQHANDLKRFMLVNNRQAIANWFTESLIKDYKSK